jgi:hypothetical protein
MRETAVESRPFRKVREKDGHPTCTATLPVQWKDEWRYWPWIAVGEEDFVADFYIYADDSGKFDNEKCEYTALCGYVSHVSEWHRVGMEWRNCLLRFQVPYIHMAPIMFPDRGKDHVWKDIKAKWGKDWEYRRDMLLHDLGTILRSAQIVAVGAVVDVAHFRSLADSEFKRVVQDDPLFLAFHQVVLRGIEKTEIVDKCSSIGIVIDDDRESSLSCYKMLHILKQTFPKVRERISLVSFANDVRYPGIQAADMLAYESRKLMVERKKDPNYQPSDLWFSLTLLGINQPLFYSPKLLDMLNAEPYDGSVSDDSKQLAV